MGLVGWLACFMQILDFVRASSGLVKPGLSSLQRLALTVKFTRDDNTDFCIRA